MGSPYLQWRMVPILMYEIFFDQRTFGDGVRYGMVPIIIYEDSWMRYPLINVHLGMGSPYLQWRMVPILMYEIFFDQRTFGDGVRYGMVPIIIYEDSWMRYPLINVHLGMGSPYLQWRMVPILMYEIFFDQRTFGDGVRYGMVPIIIYEDSWMRYPLINVHLGMGSLYLQMEWFFDQRTMEYLCRLVDEISTYDGVSISTDVDS